MPAEWEKQQCVLMSFPHEETDWHNPNNKADLQAALYLLYVLPKLSHMDKLFTSSVKTNIK